MQEKPCRLNRVKVSEVAKAAAFAIRVVPRVKLSSLFMGIEGFFVYNFIRRNKK